MLFSQITDLGRPIPVNGFIRALSYRRRVCALGGTVVWFKNCIQCDNEAAVHIINKGRSKIPLIMKFMRKLTLCSAKNNFIILAQHISGVKNFIADALSRLRMDRFRHLAPQADPVPKPCPTY